MHFILDHILELLSDKLCPMIEETKQIGYNNDEESG